ncbi:MAG: hypothetical protein P0119_13545 [Nitrospira sp.]|nr:hypothetical protein [Nitrospira sp.]
MARKRAPQQIIEAIQQEIQLTLREFAQALRVNEVWFRKLITTDQLPSVPPLTTLFTLCLQQAPKRQRPHRELVSRELLAACAHSYVHKHLERSRSRSLSLFSERMLPLLMS